MKKKLIVFMGPLGSGKVQWIDYIKKKINAPIIEQYNNRVINDNDIVILSNNFTTEKERKELLDLINKDIIKVIGIWVENTWESISQSNLKNIEETTLKNTFKSRWSPGKDEAFDDIYFLTINADLGISRSHPHIKDVQTTIDRLIGVLYED